MIRLQSQSTRGRRKDNSLPLSRPLNNQRTFRARKATYLANLENDFLRWQERAKDVDAGRRRVGVLIETFASGERPSESDISWARNWCNDSSIAQVTGGDHVGMRSRHMHGLTRGAQIANNYMEPASVVPGQQADIFTSYFGHKSLTRAPVGENSVPNPQREGGSGRGKASTSDDSWSEPVPTQHSLRCSYSQPYQSPTSGQNPPILSDGHGAEMVDHLPVWMDSFPTDLNSGQLFTLPLAGPGLHVEGRQDGGRSRSIVPHWLPLEQQFDRALPNGDQSAPSLFQSLAMRANLRPFQSHSRSVGVEDHRICSLSQTNPVADSHDRSIQEAREVNSKQNSSTGDHRYPSQAEKEFAAHCCDVAADDEQGVHFCVELCDHRSGCHVSSPDCLFHKVNYDRNAPEPAHLSLGRSSPEHIESGHVQPAYTPIKPYDNGTRGFEPKWTNSTSGMGKEDGVLSRPPPPTSSFSQNDLGFLDGRRAAMFSSMHIPASLAWLLLRTSLENARTQNQPAENLLDEQPTNGKRSKGARAPMELRRLDIKAIAQILKPYAKCSEGSCEIQDFAVAEALLHLSRGLDSDKFPTL